MIRRISPAQWQAAADAHRRRVECWTNPYRQRRKLGQSHPIEDFLFVYYRYSPGKLEHWHPGVDVLLENAAPGNLPVPPGYRRLGSDLLCDRALIRPKERRRLEWTATLLQATAGRPANLGCYGLHEWAMVYRGQEIRHEATTPLRLPQAEIDALVESRPPVCSHFDAFRFFAPAARGLNRLQPSLQDRPQQEQPGCVHANMDLYKWAYKSQPWVGSDLVADCFQLALEARRIDMRASPYDLSAYEPRPPIRIETAEGRAEYVAAQRAIQEAAAPLRRRLIESLQRILRDAPLRPNDAENPGSDGPQEA